MIITEDARNDVRPGDKGKVGIGALIPHEIFSAFERGVEHAVDAEDFFLVALLG